MPNVPKVPGVPPLSSYAANTAILLTQDLISSLLSLGRPQWGLFKGGVPVIVANSVVSVDFKRDWTIADYPLEQGAFESYDKVQNPLSIKIRFSTGGSEFQRQALLDSVDAAAESLELFDAVTPEETYENVNVMHYDYRRTSHAGLGLMVVDVWCIEVRDTAQAAFTSAKSPSGTPIKNIGTVQPTPASPAQSSNVTAVQ